MGVTEDDYVGIGVHVERQMHQFKFGIGQFEVIGFLDKVISVVKGVKMRVIVAIDGNIFFTGSFDLFKVLGCSDIAGMNKKFGAF